MNDSDSDYSDSQDGSGTESELDFSDLDTNLEELENVEIETASSTSSTGGQWIGLPVVGEDVGPRPIAFTAHPGPRHVPASNSKPIDYVNLFLTDDFLNTIITETNRYAEHFISANTARQESSPRSCVHEWSKKGSLHIIEFRAFLGIYLNMGLVDKPNFNAYWDSAHFSQNTPWFHEHFNRDRFKIIFKFLHFADNSMMPQQNDPRFKLYKVDKIVQHFNKKFIFHYQPYQNISIDESMIGFKGRTPHLRQFMPNKRHGIKMWCLSDSSNGYLCQIELYGGSQKQTGQSSSTAPAKSFMHDLVMRLMVKADLLNRGHHLGIDNFFTSVDLLEDLFQENTKSTGTVRSNRKGLPESVTKKKLKNKEATAARKDNLLCLSYQDNNRKHVLLSTFAKAGFINSVNSKKQPVSKPAVILAYNQAIGGVDLADEKLFMYTSEIKSLKWTNKVFIFLVSRAVLNSYILYQLNTTDSPKLSRYRFMISVVESLIDNYAPPKMVGRKRTHSQMEDTPPVLPQARPMHPLDGHDLEKLPVGKKRNCVAGHENRVRTAWQCTGCNVGLCPDCFAKYHREL